jgi:hypothetical protein
VCAAAAIIAVFLLPVLQAPEFSFLNGHEPVHVERGRSLTDPLDTTTFTFAADWELFRSKAIAETRPLGFRYVSYGPNVYALRKDSAGHIAVYRNLRAKWLQGKSEHEEISGWITVRVARPVRRGIWQRVGSWLGL